MQKKKKDTKENQIIRSSSLFLLVAPTGIEPVTQGFSVPCSTD